MKTKSKTMAMVTSAAVMAILCVAMASPAMATYIEQFSADNASWNYGYDTNFISPQLPANWVGAGGNPDGHISGDSANLYAVWTYVTAPYGDMSGGLGLTVDTKKTDGETGNAEFYVGRGGTYFIDSVDGWNISGDTDWTTHTTVLDSAHFTPWTGLNDNIYSLTQVLQAPTDIGIFFGGGLANGTGQLLVDNYGTTVPEPSTLVLLAGLVGMFALGYLRRK